MTMLQRFLLRICAFFLIQGALFGGLLLCFEPGPEAEYLAATFDKHRRLDQTRPPRIILVGGSNAALGFRSDLIEEALGRPVVNMGLMAGVGIEFMLNEIRDDVDKGDIVVLSFEFQLFSGGFDRDVTRQLIAYRPKNILHVNVDELPRILTEHGLGFLCQIARCSIDALIRPETWGRPNENPFVRGGFNAWGDCTAHYGLAPRLAPLEPSPTPPMVYTAWLPSPPVIGWLTGFVSHCHENGVRIIYTFPPQPADYLADATPTVTVQLDHLRAVPHLEIVDAPAEQVYPLAFFYDSPVHLTKEGAEERSRRLIRSLQRILPQGRTKPEG